METSELLKVVNEIFAEVFEDPRLIVGQETTAKDIPAWDSIAHIHLIVALEKRLNVQFTTAEIRGWKNVGEMCQCIQNKPGI